MPKMDGLSVLEYIRNDGSLRCLPVVVLTASEAEEDRLKSYNLGANAYIVKPVGFDNLSEAVRTINLPDVAIWPFVIEISIVISHFSTFNTCNPCMTYRGLISNRWHSDTLTTPVLHPPA